MNYFDLPQVSNSDLKALAMAYYAIAMPDAREAFKFGSLVDALLTEPTRVNRINFTLIDDRGNVIQYDTDTFYLAVRLADDLRKDPVIAQLIGCSIPQYVFVRNVTFTYEGVEYCMAARCKYDLFSKRFSIGTEFKTTACTSLKSYIESIYHFDYDQAAALYLDIARIDRMWMIAKSKVNGKTFKHAIERGDEIYKSGLDKYSMWGYRWVTLVKPFKNYITNEICTIQRSQQSMADYAGSEREYRKLSYLLSH